MGHAAASDISSHLDPIVCELDHSKLIQLSMDGPNVNWKVSQHVGSAVHGWTKRQLESITAR